jgi:CDP-diacylglycerol---glycerol-3-phosphate 3-phosphatidyltransferase
MAKKLALGNDYGNSNNHLMSFVKNLRSADNIFNLPNSLTLFRIALLPVMALLLDWDREQPSLDQDWMFRYSPGRIAAFVVLLAGISDLMDGWLARKWNIESLLGKFLDPVADKLFLMVGLVMLMKLDRVEPWLVMLLLSRELLITGLRGVAAGEGLMIGAGKFGKLKLTFQLIGLGFLMWYGSAFGFSAFEMGTYILYFALFISLYSGFFYLRDFFIALKNKRGYIRPPKKSGE